MMPLRILHVIPTYFPAVRYGGPVYAVRSLVAALVREGHEVRVLTTNMDGPGILDVPTSTATELDGAQIRYCAANAPQRLNVSYQLCGALPSELARCQVVHFHSMFSFPTTTGALFARVARRPYVLSPRGSLVPELIAAKSPRLKRVWLNLLDRRTLLGAARLCVASTAEFADARRVGLGLPPPCVIPNGVSAPDVASLTPTEATAQIARRGPYVLFLGRISWKKRIELLLEALVDTPIRLVIAGNDEEDYTPQLREAARRLGVTDRVDFVGHVGGDDKFWLMSQARCFALTSINENFGNAVVEAMAVGCPVVSTPEIGASSHVRDARAGAVVAAAASAVRDALMRFWENESERLEAGKRGRDFTRTHLSWRAVAQQTADMYRAVLAGDSLPA